MYLLAALLAVCLAATSAAQDAVRGWSWRTFDSDAWGLPTSHIVSSHGRTAILRADGRLYVQGRENAGAFGMCRPPQAPPGRSIRDVVLGRNCGMVQFDDGAWLPWPQPSGFYQWQPPALPAGTSYRQVSLGAEHALALRSDGVVVGWAATPSHAALATIPTLPSGVGVVRCHAGDGWSMLHLANGSLLAWDAGGVSHPASQVPTPMGGLVYAYFWAGPSHVVAELGNGTWLAWGDNGSGQCDIPPLPTGVAYVAFACGGYHTVALRSDGKLVAWGDNSAGQCEPIAIPAGRTVAQFVAGAQVTLVRLDDGTLLARGGADGDAPLASLDVGERFVDLAVGPVTSLAVTSQGRIVPLGTSAFGLEQVPPLPSGLAYERVAIGWQHAAALRSDGAVVAWGEAADGRTNVPPLPANMRYVQVALGGRRTVLVRSDGVALALGAPSLAIPALPQAVRYVAADCEADAVLLLRSDGALELGGSSVPSLPIGVVYTDLATSDWYRAALRSDGQIVAWWPGGAPTAIAVPALPAGVHYVEIDGGQDFTIARRSDGQVVTFGVGLTGWHTQPLPLRPGESYVQVSAYASALAARVGPTSTHVGFGAGCSGSGTAPRLVPSDTPRLGERFGVRVFGLPIDIGLLVLGWQRTGGVSLASQGAPGCVQEVSVDAVQWLFGQHGVATAELAIPPIAALQGLRFYQQAVALDPVGNALGAVVSGAAEGVVGR